MKVMTTPSRAGFGPTSWLPDPPYRRALREHRLLFDGLVAIQEEVEAAAAMLVQALVAGKKLMLCGNGGSAADSQHIAAELTGRFVHDRRPLAAMALTTDSSALTCIANDYDFDQVFARQVRALGQAGDCLVAISTSGNSPNVLRAAEAARRMRITTVALTGRSGGRLGETCDAAIVVPSSITARIQEAHIFVGHVLCALVEDGLTRAGILHTAQPALAKAQIAPMLPVTGKTMPVT